jgi:hypothetical protein
VLLVSDPTAAAVYAFDVSDLDGKGIGKDEKVTDIRGKLAAMLGTETRSVEIVDVAVDPSTQQAYLAVRRGRGDRAVPVLIRVGALGKLSEVTLAGRKFSMTKLANVPPTPRPADAAAPRGGRRGRGRNRRVESITDLAWVDGKILVAGLSNEEFASKLRVLEYPLQSSDAGTSVKIFHGAHGRLETRSPIRTFVPYELGGEMQVVAAYTCTPLVLFPVKALEPGKLITGKTVAELGNRNRPLDMIVYESDGKDYLLIANSARGVMKVKTDGMKEFEHIDERVEGGATKGVPYETIKSIDNVLQLAKLDAKHALVLVQSADGKQALAAIPLP